MTPEETDVVREEEGVLPHELRQLATELGRVGGELKDFKRDLDPRLARIHESHKDRVADLSGRVERERERVDAAIKEQSERCDEDNRRAAETRTADRRSLIGIGGSVFAILIWIINASIAPVSVAVDALRDEIAKHEAMPSHVQSIGVTFDVQARVQILEERLKILEEKAGRTTGDGKLEADVENLTRQLEKIEAELATVEVTAEAGLRRSERNPP